MAHRYWEVGHSMGYVGTDSRGEIDALEFFQITEDELEKMKDSDVQEKLLDAEYETAQEKISVWANKM
jgi:hypothetical protein